MIRYHLPRPLAMRTTRIVRTPVRTRAFISAPDIVEVSYFVGKSMTLFIGFFCGLQWLHYKQIADELDNNNDKKKKKRDQD